MSEAVKTVGRRLFAKATVGIPLALKNGAAASSGLGQGAMIGGGIPNMGSGMTAAKAGFVDTVWKAVRAGTKVEQEYGQMRWIRRQMMGGLDPDLAVLNSMSLQRRVQIQIDREKDIQQREQSIRHRIIKGFGGNPEDFE